MTPADPFEHDDAAYVLGLLPAAERDAFEEHLRGCDACSGRVRELHATAALLRDLDAGDLAEAEHIDAVPDTLLPSLLRRAGMARRRQRWFATGLGAVAAACLIALAVVLWPSAGSPAARPQQLVAVSATPLSATATLTSLAWGTRISLDCTYRGSQPAGQAYTYGLTVVTKDGAKHQLGTWTVTAGRDTRFTSGIAVSTDQIRAVQITTYDGTPVLALTR